MSRWLRHSASLSRRLLTFRLSAALARGWSPRTGALQIPCPDSGDGRIPSAMRTAASTLTILLVLALLPSCGRRDSRMQFQRPVPPVAQIPPSATAPETGPYVVIGHLVHRDRIITVKSGGQGA